jgi:seryl-tRNA synthetase
MSRLSQEEVAHNREMAEFRMMLLESGLILCAGDGDIAGYSAEFEKILDSVSRLVGNLFPEMQPEILKFPALITRKSLERSRYMEGFPQLGGVVHCFCGDARAHQQMLACIGENGDWSRYLTPTGTALTPASCYPVYPLVATRGRLGEGGCFIDVSSYCFRHEPSIDPIRLQMFQQREFVCIGQTEYVEAFLEKWLTRSLATLRSCGLEVESDLACDAFFGRFRSMLSDAQKAERLKMEVLVPISHAGLSACGSSNNHKTHFSAAFDIRLETGELAQTACAGFGLERLALALIRRHGTVLSKWPDGVRMMLGLYP